MDALLEEYLRKVEGGEEVLAARRREFPPEAEATRQMREEERLMSLERAGRARAEALLEEHPLRTADAYQLSAALEWRGGIVAGAGFVCFDGRLRTAAEAEGFDVLPR